MCVLTVSFLFGMACVSLLCVFFLMWQVYIPLLCIFILVWHIYPYCVFFWYGMCTPTVRFLFVRHVYPYCEFSFWYGMCIPSVRFLFGMAYVSLYCACFWYGTCTYPYSAFSIWYGMQSRNMTVLTDLLSWNVLEIYGVDSGVCLDLKSYISAIINDVSFALLFGYKLHWCTGGPRLSQF